MTDYLMENVYIIWFLTYLSSTWWYHFFIEKHFSFISQSEYQRLVIYTVLSFESLHSAFHQFHLEFLAVICNSIIY